MIRGLGIDLVEISRFRKALERHGERFEQRVFTARELADCASRSDRLVALAARFAAKEAALKALGTGWAQGLGFRQIEIRRASGGAPNLRLYAAALERSRKLGVTRMHVSLTHQPNTAAAVVVLE